MEKQHSPLPWALKLEFYGPKYDPERDCQTAILDSAGVEVINDGIDQPWSLGRGDSAMIVKSVNNHESLTKALKTCVVALYAHPELSSRAREAIQEAEAVLGQLEGKE